MHMNLFIVYGGLTNICRPQTLFKTFGMQSVNDYAISTSRRMCWLC